MSDDDLEEGPPPEPPHVGGAADVSDVGRTAQTISDTTSDAVGAGRRLADAAQSDDIGRAASATGSATDSARYIVPDREAREALSGANPAASTMGGADAALEQMGSGVGGGSRDPVSFHLEVDGLDGPLQVRHVQLVEGLNQLSTCSVVFRCSDHPTARDLLRRECDLSIERSSQTRSFKGVVQHAKVGEDVEGVHVTLRIVPALWYLSQIVTSRIHQHTTVPDLVDGLVRELLGGQQRSVRNGTTATYRVHEYLVQYQESYFDFLNRLCEQEGIFWFFDHDQDKEVLVIADSTSGLPDARSGDNQVQFARLAGQARDVEVVHAAEHDEHVGATDIVLSGYDWTRPNVAMGDDRTGRGDQEPALEIYDHTDAMTYHGYQEPTYQEDTASAQASLRMASLDLSRQSWSMRSTFVGARPGHLFELVNCPNGDLDGRYLIVSVSSSGSARGDGTGAYSSSLTCVPTAVPYHPDRRTPRPVVAGFESATVVTDGREIQTDVHGRVKVQFHWDRLGQNDDHSSCWIRVMHNWAGEGFGTFFLPRRGMEVIVGFLGGNPDQPIVTGCVYNGANPVPVELDAKRTQSVIRTKSSENSEGFNELRFEDQAGSEFIYVHAEKDFNEVVEHCHTTHVKVDQTNTVDHDHTETVGHDQKLHVENDRTKNVDANEKTEIGGNRTEEVTGHEQIHVHEWRKVKIEQDDKLVVHANREMKVDGKDTEDIVGGRDVTVAEFDNLHVIAGANRNESISGQLNVVVSQKYALTQGGTEKIVMDSKKTHLESGKEIELKTGASDYVLKDDGNVKLKAASKVEIEVGGSKIEITTSTIKLTAGASSIELGPSGVTVSGPKITSSAQGMQEITGLLVKIN